MSLVEVKRLNPISDGGNLLAYADVTIDDNITVYGVRLVRGENGTFVSMPSKKSTDKDGNTKYYNIVSVNKSVSKDITSAVEKELDMKVNQERMDQVQKNLSGTWTKVTYDKERDNR